MKLASFVITGTGSLLMHNPAGMRASTGEIERGGKKFLCPPMKHELAFTLCRTASVSFT
jgi:hypothetical protein